MKRSHGHEGGSMGMKGGFMGHPIGVPGQAGHGGRPRSAWPWPGAHPGRGGVHGEGGRGPGEDAG